MRVDILFFMPKSISVWAQSKCFYLTYQAENLSVTFQQISECNAYKELLTEFHDQNQIY